MAAAASASSSSPSRRAATAPTDASSSEGPAASTQLLDEHDTALTACALEACCWPAEGDGSTPGCWVVCGTYQLVKGPEGSSSSRGDRRKGSLLLYRLGEGPRLIPQQTVALEDEGVLDCKWCVRLSFDVHGKGHPGIPLIHTARLHQQAPAAAAARGASKPPAAGLCHVARAHRHVHAAQGCGWGRRLAAIGTGPCQRGGGQRVHVPGPGKQATGWTPSIDRSRAMS